MSYHQDGGSIIHLPASTHTAYSHLYRQQHGNSTNTSSSTSTTAARIMNYGTTVNAIHPATLMPLNIAATTPNANTASTLPSTLTLTSIMTTSPNTNSGNLSMAQESHHNPSLMEAGELLLAAPVVPVPGSNGNTSHRRGKPDIAFIMSLLSFLVWLRLLQTMFYQSTLGQLGGFVKELLCVFLVWIPSVTLTCFYFRSDDHQPAYSRRYFRSWGRS